MSYRGEERCPHISVDGGIQQRFQAERPAEVPELDMVGSQGGQVRGNRGVTGTTVSGTARDRAWSARSDLRAAVYGGYGEAVTDGCACAVRQANTLP